MERLAANDNKRLLKVTAGNLRQSHLYITGLHDFFPAGCIGPARKSAKGNANQIEIVLDGLNETIQTDIGVNAQTGKPRGFFRGRTWVRRFFEHHSVNAGDDLQLERLGGKRYRLSFTGPSGNGNGRVLKAAEFFAGIGLVRLALERQGWQVVFANDIDPDKAEMYRHNWPKDNHFVLEDIHKLNPAEIPTCDLFTASFPCNDLSIAGRWEGLNGKQSSAYWGFLDVIRGMGKRRPPVVLLENVLGFLMSRGGQDLAEALSALNQLGYNVDAVILNAVHWVPQSRVRLFIIGKLDTGEDRCTFCMASGARPPALIDFIGLHQEIQWDLSELPHLPTPRRKLVDIVEDLPDDDPQWWNDKRTRYFMDQLSDRHAVDAQQMIDGKSPTYATAFRRVRNGRSMAELRTDGIAGCLRTPRGGSGRQILFKAGRGEFKVRLLTARECARLQGVPDEYLIDVGLNKALFGFGDAVCVPAVEWVIQHYLMRVAARIMA
ncbi:MAG TPA: DNA (cytosine-5-)-methyltransferase [Gemmataceae bacterium]|nr:DNA (cytosine-5-)-methyltransferase [Gemmataceae bacterium]